MLPSATPRKTQVDVAKVHACHAKCTRCCGRPGAPSAPPHPACHAKCKWLLPSATPPARCRWMSPRARGTPATNLQQAPRLPRKAQLCKNAKSNACPAKCKWMSPRAAPATQRAGGAAGDQCGPTRATRPSPRQQGSRLRRQVQVDVAKRHACHAKRV